MIDVLFVGGRHAGHRRLDRCPSLVVLTLGHQHTVYSRRVDPDTLEYVNIYDYVTTRYGTDEAIS